MRTLRFCERFTPLALRGLERRLRQHIYGYSSTSSKPAAREKDARSIAGKERGESKGK